MWFKNVDFSKMKVKHNVLSWDDNMYTMNKKSWHYKLATAGKDQWDLEYWEENCDNFCKYARSVLNGMLRVAGLVLTIAGLTCISVWAVGDFLGWIFWMLWHMTFVDPDLGAQLVTALIVIITGIIIFVGVAQAFKAIARKVSVASHNIAVAVEKKDSGFISALYKKYKQNICFKVDYK